MKHHDDAVDAFVRSVADDPTVVGVVISGSVARGTERADSDVDLYLIVTEERWHEAAQARRLMFTSVDGIGYDGGYYDLKLATLSYLDDAAARGDDPVRDSFAHVRVAFSRVDDLGERLRRIADVPDSRWDDLCAGFVAQCRLHGGYFLEQAHERGDRMLLAHASTHLATSAARALLAHNRVFFSGPKYLAALTRTLPDKPDGFDGMLTALLDDPTPATARTVMDAVESTVGAFLPEEETLSRFVLDNELAWRTGRSPVEYR